VTKKEAQEGVDARLRLSAMKTRHRLKLSWNFDSELVLASRWPRRLPRDPWGAGYMRRVPGPRWMHTGPVRFHLYDSATAGNRLYDAQAFYYAWRITEEERARVLQRYKSAGDSLPWGTAPTWGSMDLCARCGEDYHNSTRGHVCLNPLPAWEHLVEDLREASPGRHYTTLVCRCPFHTEKRRSFRIDPHMYRFGCTKCYHPGGKLSDLASRIEEVRNGVNSADD